MLRYIYICTLAHIQSIFVSIKLQMSVLRALVVLLLNEVLVLL